MLNIGIGATHVQSFLAALNVPSMHHKFIRTREKDMGKKIIEVAEESCKEALEEEKEMSRVTGNEN